ncbi:hypothetical protein ACP70R_043667 [Stipagrostis hirtigluma subsp. patula]
MPSSTWRPWPSAPAAGAPPPQAAPAEVPTSPWERYPVVKVNDKLLIRGSHCTAGGHF